MTTDSELRRLLAAVAADVPDATDATDAESLARLNAAAKSPRRPPIVRLAALGVAAAVVAGLVLTQVFANGGRTVLDSGSVRHPASDDGLNGGTDPVPTTEAATPATGSTGRRPMVVVDRGGARVVVYFDDGRAPLVYEPPRPVVHASLADGKWLWLTTEGKGYASVLDLVDPRSGAVLERVPKAGFAATSPDGSQLAYSIVSSYGGTDQAVVIRDVATRHERTIPGDDGEGPQSIVGSFRQLTWSPDGTRLVVDEGWEDDAIWLIDVRTANFVFEGLTLDLEGAAWIGNDRLLSTAYCCYADPDKERRHLVEVDLSGPEPRVIDREERAQPIVGAPPERGLETAVYADPDGDLRRLADGTLIASAVVSVAW